MDASDVGLLYFGLKEEPDKWIVHLPDGITVRVWNINPDCENQMVEEFGNYSHSMDVGRRVLLTGGTAADAVKKMCEFCIENQFLPELEPDPELRANLFG